MRKKRKKKKKRDRHKLNRRIEQMRRILNWTENARIQVERGNRVKRWKRGENMIRESNPRRWMGKSMEEITELKELEEKADAHMEELLEARYEINEQRRRTAKNLEMLREVQEDERGTKSFFGKMKVAHSKEEIFALIEEQIDPETEEKVEVEYRELTDLQRIATDFCTHNLIILESGDEIACVVACY